MNIYMSAIVSLLIICAIPLLGFLVLIMNKEKLDKNIHLMVSFAAGALLGNSIIHILPEIFNSGVSITHISLSIISGIIIFYSMEQFLMWRHCHEQTTKNHTHPVGIMNQIGDTVHNFIDGILIASSFLISPILGWSTVLAVITHEIPQEIADFGVLLYAKWSVSKILLANLVSAFFAFFGLFLGFWLNSQFELFSIYAVAVTAGGFIYIACTDLLPDLHKNGGIDAKERILQLMFMFAGILIFLVI